MHVHISHRSAYTERIEMSFRMSCHTFLSPDAVKEHIWVPLVPKLDVLPFPCSLVMHLVMHTDNR